MTGILITLWTFSLAASPTPPPTPKIPVVDVYHGTKVVDDYRWLENWSDPKVQQWSSTQNAYAREVLDHMPNVDTIRRRVTQIMSAQTVSYGGLAYRDNKYFIIKNEPPKQQPLLIVVSSLNELDQPHVLVDPNAIDKQGTTSIDWFEPSPQGELVAVSLSKAGSEVGNVHLYETATGREVYEEVPRVNCGTAGGDLAWSPDGSGFFYTRYPQKGERPDKDLLFYQQAYYHKLGTPIEQDQYVMGKDLPRIAEIEFEMHDASDTLLITVQNGDGGEFAHYLRSADGKIRQFSHFDDRIVQATFTPDGDILVISREGAPRGKIERLSRGNFTAQELIPESDATIVTTFYRDPPSLVATKNRIYVLYQLGGPTEIRAFDANGQPVAGPQQAPISTAGDMVPTRDDQLLFTRTSYTEPLAYYSFDAATGTTEKTKLANDAPVTFDHVKVVREFAVSKDGTKVPVNIMMPDNVERDGTNPLVLNGYGGYGVSLTPSFVPTRIVLLESGCIYAVANLRGGGEYGESWHRQGNLLNKQNVFDDFAAVAEHLIEQGYTSSAKLGLIGGSNGGLLMGATLTQHPHLMRAVVSFVGIYDMLRVELSPNGAFNIPEYGSVKNPEQFRACMHILRTTTFVIE